VSAAPRVRLISLRLPDDAMAAHEHLCFVRAAGIPAENLELWSMVHGRPRDWSGVDVVLFGGSGAYSVLDDVAWIQDGLVCLQDVVERRIPAWASCFGFQGLAKALGGEVIHDESRSEIGAVWLSLTPEGAADPLLGGLPPQFWGQQGHHDRVARLPAGVTRLATGEVCPEQAFRVDGAPFWAAQFHPELTPQAMVERYEHYRAHYPEAGADGDAVVRKLASAPETHAVTDLVRRVVWGEY